MEWQKQLDLAIAIDNKSKVKDLLQFIKEKLPDGQIIEVSSKVKLLNLNYQNTTLLSLAIKKGNLEIISLLLQAGANADGLSENGYAHDVPIFTLARNHYKNVELFKKILDLLLEYQVDLNGFGTNLISALDDLCNISFSNVIYSKNIFDCISYLFQKGTNPNIRYYNPFTTFLYSIKNIENKIYYNTDQLFRKERINFYMDMTKLFISYGLNPYLSNINGFNTFKLLNKLNQETSQNTQSIYAQIKELLSQSILDILRECKEENKEIILSYANAFKIESKDLKDVCGCILKFNEYKKNIPLEEILERRKEKNKLGICNNEFSLIGSDINEYPDSEIIILKDNNVDYCFHSSEIPIILKSKKNPYTNKTLTHKQILKLSQELNIKPKSELTLEEALELFDDIKKGSIPFNYQVYYEILRRLINPFNPYIQLEKIEKCRVILLNYLINKITSIDNSQFLPNLEFVLPEYEESYLTLNRYKILNSIFKIIEKSLATVNTIAFFLSETFELLSISEGIIKLLEVDFGYSLQNSKFLLKEATFNQLINISVEKDGQNIFISPEAVLAIKNFIEREASNFKNLGDPFWVDKLWNDYLKIIISE